MRITVLLLASIVLAGCGPTKPETVVPNINVDLKAAVVCDNAKPVDEIVLKPFSWTVINQAMAGGNIVSWISLSPEGYQSLQTNLGLIWQQREQLLAQIKYYEDCVRSATAPKTKPIPEIDPRTLAKSGEMPEVASSTPKAKIGK